MIERLKTSLASRVAQKFLDDHAPNWAVQIAWSALLAMFPIILIAVAALGALTGMTGLGGGDVRRTVAAVFPDADAQRQVQEALRNFKQQSGLFAVVGFAGLFLSGSALFGAMDQAFAEVYQARSRSLVSQRLMSIGMILLFTALIGLAVLSSSLLPALKNLGGIVPWSLTSGPLAFILQAVVGVLAGFILYATIYYVVPNRRQRWRQVLLGALVAGVLLELVTLLFPVYLSLNRGMAAYGKTFGLLFVLMTFFFFLGLITMLGAEVNSVLYPVELKREILIPAGGVSAIQSEVPVSQVSHGSHPGGRLVPGGFKTVIGAGVIGWAIGVVTGRSVGR
jgi:membrane protein